MSYPPDIHSFQFISVHYKNQLAETCLRQVIHHIQHLVCFILYYNSCIAAEYSQDLYMLVHSRTLPMSEIWEFLMDETTKSIIYFSHFIFVCFGVALLTM